VIRARNVHEALPIGLKLLRNEGIHRQSRNGPVRVYPEPVTTLYAYPHERVVFWSQRDANPFLHLYESLWMLAGRNDVAPLVKYVDRFNEYSDDGVTLHGAYGYRWRKHFCMDQLPIIAHRLKHDPTDRRCVLQMWDVEDDLGKDGRDLPCNLTVTFQINHLGELEMTVFNRSNDIIWGAYGANAVHFSMLQEYMSCLTGVKMGVYRQVSVNYHAYVDVLEKLVLNESIANPYDNQVMHWVVSIRMPSCDLDAKIGAILDVVDSGFCLDRGPTDLWSMAILAVLKAHHIWATWAAPEKYTGAIEVLRADGLPLNMDWIVAAEEWILRRQARWQERMAQGGQND